MKSTARAARTDVRQPRRGATPRAARPGSVSLAPTAEEKALLAMSPRAYMNRRQLEFFRRRLLAMKERALADARAAVAELRVAASCADANDCASIEEDNRLAMRRHERERSLLKKIGEALARIEDGSYGYCLDTGEPIGLQRLLARPTAEYGLEAKQRRERLERQYGENV
jgi:DnaK suppressor protein